MHVNRKRILMGVIILTLVHFSNAKITRHVYVWGCNDFQKTSKNEPVTFSCGSSNDIIFNPFELLHQNESFSPLNIIHACATDLNTVIFTEHKIFAAGANFGIIPSYKTVTPYMTEVYNTLNDNYKIHGDTITKPYCTSRDVYFRTFNGSQELIFGFGQNHRGNFGISHITIVNVPILLHVNTSILVGGKIVSIMSRSGKIINTCGSNENFQIGFDEEFSYSQYHFDSISISSAQDDMIDNIFIGHTHGVFVVWKSNMIHYWGLNQFSLSKDVVPQDPQKIPLDVTDRFFIPSQIPKTTSKILQISIHSKAAFALIEVNNINTVYSWGVHYTSHAVFSGRIYDGQSWWFPVPIHIGEMEPSEKVLFITNGFHNTFFFTDKSHIYVIGTNSYGGIGSEIGYADEVRNMKRIFKDIKGTINVLKTNDNFLTHYIVLFERDDDLLSGNEWIYISIGILSTLGCLCILFIILLIIFYFILKITLKKEDEKLKDINMKSKPTQEFESEEIKLFKQMARKDEVFTNFFGSWKLENSKFLQRINLIKYEELQLKRFIGSGGSGTSIFLADYRAPNEDKPLEIVLKSFPIIYDRLEQSLSTNSKSFNDFKKELFIYSKTSHPFILKCKGILITKRNLGLLIDYCKCGDLKEFITKHSDLPIHERMVILFKIASGMCHLHFNDIIHRDLKCQNVLIDENFTPKIMDFGLSKFIQNSFTKTKNIGTIKYQAPELVMSGKYNEKVDIFAFSIMAFEFLTGNFDPFGESTYNGGNIAIEICSNSNFRPNVQELEVILKDDKWMLDLIARGWSEHANERPSFLDICKAFKTKYSKMYSLKGQNIHVEKQKRNAIIVYFCILKEDDEYNEEEAEDFEINIFKIVELKRIVRKWLNEKKRWKEKMEMIFFIKTESGMLEIRTDESLSQIKNDSIVFVKLFVQ